MTQGPLSAEELDWLDDIIMKHGNEAGVLDASELDGLLTAVLSAPTPVAAADWQAAIWGGKTPAWGSAGEQQRFSSLIAQHMNDIAERLRDYPDQFEPLFGTREEEGEEFTIVEEWCIGFMKGVDLADWSSLPDALQSDLQAIALHGREENIPRLERMSADEFARSVDAIRSAVLNLQAKPSLH